jgi:predicted GNAT family N-acyltransferase
MNFEIKKTHSEAKIIIHPNMSKLPEDLLQELASQEREWYGYDNGGRGFGEYAICSDPKCRRAQSVEDSYPQVLESPGQYIPLSDLEENGAQLSPCPDCNGSTELLLDPKYFTEYLKFYFSWKVHGALLMHDDKIKGAVSAFTGQLREVFEDNINYRGGYNVDEFIEKIARKTKKPPKEVASQKVACCNRIAISHDMRGNGYLPKLLKAVLDQHPEHDHLPGIGDARTSGPIYPLAKITGYKPVIEDQYGYTCFYADRFGNFRDAFNLPPEEFKIKHSEELRNIRVWQQRHIQDKPNGPKRIVGAPLLHEIFNDDQPIETAEGKKIEIETITSIELNDEKLKEIANFFRFIFNNLYDGQYLTYPSIGTPISVQQVFGVDKDTCVPLEQLDVYDTSQFPVHSETDEKAIFWHNPEVTFQRFKEKSKKDAHFAIFRDCETEKIAGLIFGHICTLKEAFETEEWENPLYYSSIKNPEQFRDFQVFLNNINKKLKSHDLQQLYPDSLVYSWNLIATRQDVRGLKYFLKLMKHFLNLIPKEIKKNLIVIGEAKHKSTAYTYFKMCGLIDVPGILTDGETLKKDDPHILVGSLSQLAQTFSLPLEEFITLKKILGNS